MNKTNLEIAFILDESGSMRDLWQETINGYNKTLEEQKGKEGKALVTTIAFNEFSRIIHDGEDIEKVRPITKEDYSPSGCTALYDAIGTTIEKVATRQKENKSDKTMIVIITDGMENASIEYTGKAIKNLINAKEEQGWEFLFLGANIDSIQTAGDIGIKRDNAVDYKPDREGLEVVYKCLSRSVSKMRTKGSIDKKWKESIEKDYESRNK